VSFHSFFWEGARLPADVQEVVDRLVQGAGSEIARRATLSALLASDSVAARGIAFDHYSSLQAQARHGSVNDELLEAIGPEVRACALRELAAPPHVCSEPGTSLARGANHASAFYALWHLATPADGEAIASAMAVNDDPTVLEYALGAAAKATRGAASVAPQLAEALHRVMTSPSLSLALRERAVRALGGSRDDHVIPWLEAAIENPALEISAAAAWALLDRDAERFRNAVETRVAMWPTGRRLPLFAEEVKRRLRRRR
jgi:hypothetical protein